MSDPQPRAAVRTTISPTPTHSTRHSLIPAARAPAHMLSSPPHLIHSLAHERRTEYNTKDEEGEEDNNSEEDDTHDTNGVCAHRQSIPMTHTPPTTESLAMPLDVMLAVEEALDKELPLVQDGRHVELTRADVARLRDPVVLRFLHEHTERLHTHTRSSQTAATAQSKSESKSPTSLQVKTQDSSTNNKNNKNNNNNNNNTEQPSPRCEKETCGSTESTVEQSMNPLPRETDTFMTAVDADGTEYVIRMDARQCVRVPLSEKDLDDVIDASSTADDDEDDECDDVFAYEEDEECMHDNPEAKGAVGTTDNSAENADRLLLDEMMRWSNARLHPRRPISSSSPPSSSLLLAAPTPTTVRTRRGQEDRANNTSNRRRSSGTATIRSECALPPLPPRPLASAKPTRRRVSAAAAQTPVSVSSASSVSPTTTTTATTTSPTRRTTLRQTNKRSSVLSSTPSSAARPEGTSMKHVQPSDKVAAHAKDRHARQRSSEEAHDSHQGESHEDTDSSHPANCDAARAPVTRRITKKMTKKPPHGNRASFTRQTPNPLGDLSPTQTLSAQMPGSTNAHVDGQDDPFALNAAARQRVAEINAALRPLQRERRARPLRMSAAATDWLRRVAGLSESSLTTLACDASSSSSSASSASNSPSSSPSSPSSSASAPELGSNKPASRNAYGAQYMRYNRRQRRWERQSAAAHRRLRQLHVALSRVACVAQMSAAEDQEERASASTREDDDALDDEALLEAVLAAMGGGSSADDAPNTRVDTCANATSTSVHTTGSPENSACVDRNMANKDSRMHLTSGGHTTRVDTCVVNTNDTCVGNAVRNAPGSGGREWSVARLTSDALTELRGEVAAALQRARDVLDHTAVPPYNSTAVAHEMTGNDVNACDGDGGNEEEEEEDSDDGMDSEEWLEMDVEDETTGVTVGEEAVV